MRAKLKSDAQDFRQQVAVLVSDREGLLARLKDLSLENDALRRRAEDALDASANAQEVLPALSEELARCRSDLSEALKRASKVSSCGCVMVALCSQ